MSIPYAAQANDKGHNIDPVAEEHYNTWVHNAISYGVKVIVGASFTVLPVSLPILIKVFAGSAATSTVVSILHLFESEPEKREASYQEGITTVWEKWEYPNWYSEVEPNPFVKNATGSFDLTWRFDKDSADVFEIEIRASVNWAEVEYVPGKDGVDHWKLNPIKWEMKYLSFTFKTTSTRLESPQHPRKHSPRPAISPANPHFLSWLVS